MVNSPYPQEQSGQAYTEEYNSEKKKKTVVHNNTIHITILVCIITPNNYNYRGKTNRTPKSSDWWDGLLSVPQHQYLYTIQSAHNSKILKRGCPYSVYPSDDV